jgi:iron complex outermembrane receptor protein
VALAPRVTGTIGVAQLVARRDVRDRLGGGMTYRFAARRTLPQAGLRWRVARDVVVFGGVTATAEPPTYDDLVAVTGPYPALRRTIQPLALQRAVTYEIGGRGHRARFSWDAALYHSDWRHEILRLADANGAARGAVNAAATTRTGVEASGRWRVVEGPVRVSLVAAATWSEGRFDDDPVYGSGRVAGLPPWVSMMEATAEGPRGWFAAAGADTMAGATYVDHARRLGYGGRTLAHVRLGRHWDGAWTVAVDVRNLFDRRSIASTAGVLDLARNPAATAIFLPAPGRSVTVVFTWQSPHFR